LQTGHQIFVGNGHPNALCGFLCDLSAFVQGFASEWRSRTQAAA
jgi:hypothetical protein